MTVIDSNNRSSNRSSSKKDELNDSCFCDLHSTTHLPTLTKVLAYLSVLLVLFTTTRTVVAASSPIRRASGAKSAAFMTNSNIRNNIMSLRPTKTSGSSATNSKQDATATVASSVRGGNTRLLSSSYMGLFTNTPMYVSTGVVLATNAIGYLISVVAPKCHVHVDLLGTGAFAIASLAPGILQSSKLSPFQGMMIPNNNRIALSTMAVVAWSTRLASFLFYRVLQTGHDSRLDDILASPSSAAGFWFISAIWGVLCGLPHWIGSTSTITAAASTSSSLFFNSGKVMFGIGWIIESMSDFQKWQFKKSHPAQFCNAGLWKVCQHPNWFGNLLLWTGIYLMNAPYLIEPIAASTAPAKTLTKRIVQQVWSYRRVAVSAIGPIFMYLLFNGQANGTILPDALEATKERYGYGSNVKFTNYFDTTPSLFPNKFKLWF